MTALLLDSSSSSNNGGDCGELTPGLAVAVVAGPSGGPGACSSFSVTLTQPTDALVVQMQMDLPTDIPYFGEPWTWNVLEVQDAAGRTWSPFVGPDLFTSTVAIYPTSGSSCVPEPNAPCTYSILVKSNVTQSAKNAFRMSYSIVATVATALPESSPATSTAVLQPNPAGNSSSAHFVMLVEAGLLHAHGGVFTVTATFTPDAGSLAAVEDASLDVLLSWGGMNNTLPTWSNAMLQGHGVLSFDVNTPGMCLPGVRTATCLLYFGAITSAPLAAGKATLTLTLGQLPPEHFTTLWFSAGSTFQSRAAILGSVCSALVMVYIVLTALGTACATRSPPSLPKRFWAHFTNTKDGSFKKWAAKLTALAQIFLSFANTCGVFLYLLHNKTTTFTNPLYGGIAEAAIPWHPHGGPMTESPNILLGPRYGSMLFGNVTGSYLPNCSFPGLVLQPPVDCSLSFVPVNDRRKYFLVPVLRSADPIQGQWEVAMLGLALALLVIVHLLLWLTPDRKPTAYPPLRPGLSCCARLCIRGKRAVVDKLWDRLRWLLVLMLGMQQFANLLPLLIVQYNPYCSLLPGRGLLISMCTFSIMAQAGLASLGIAVVYFMGLYSLFTRNTWRLIMRTAVNKTICCAIFLGILAMVFAPIAALGLFYVVGGSLLGAVWSLSNALDAKLALLSILMPTVLMMWSQLQHLKLPALNLGKGAPRSPGPESDLSIRVPLMQTPTY